MRRNTVKLLVIALLTGLCSQASAGENRHVHILQQVREELAARYEGLDREDSENPLSDVYGLVCYMVVKEGSSRTALSLERKNLIETVADSMLSKLLGKAAADHEFLLISLLEERDLLVEAIGGDGPLRSAAGVVEKALSAVGCSTWVHGWQVYTAATEWGNLACAAVVSAILSAAGEMNSLILHVDYLHNHLRNRGWKQVGVSSLQAGDVVFWGRNYREHVGVAVYKDAYGEWWTVDNSSTQRVVVKRPIHGWYGRVVYDAVGKG
ncbi:MAG: hypothetical protein PHQ23_07875 [Candidatus Wallbacteria bacterium]|nr:hypothetical protein [Candidatus Wallbacteria bacterium]